MILRRVLARILSGRSRTSCAGERGEARVQRRRVARRARTAAPNSRPRAPRRIRSRAASCQFRRARGARPRPFGLPASAARSASSVFSRPTNSGPSRGKGKLNGWEAGAAVASPPVRLLAFLRRLDGGRLRRRRWRGLGSCGWRSPPRSHDLVGRVRHVLVALARRIVSRMALKFLWTNIPVTDRVERIFRGCRQQQRIACERPPCFAAAA